MFLIFVERDLVIPPFFHILCINLCHLSLLLKKKNHQTYVSPNVETLVN